MDTCITGADTQHLNRARRRIFTYNVFNVIRPIGFWRSDCILVSDGYRAPRIQKTKTTSASHLGGHRYLLLISHAPSAAVEATRHQDYVRPHPLAHFDEYEIQLSRAFADRTRWEERVSHRAGPRRIRSLLLMRELDLSLHAWDLLDSIDAPASVNDDLAAFSLAEAAPVVEELRALELYGPASLGPTDGAGERLIALSGRSSPTRQS